MSDTHIDEKSDTARTGVAIARLAGIFVSGLAINWLSNLFTPGPVIVIGVVVASLLLLVAADSPKTHLELPFLGRRARDLLKFSLAAFLLGAAVAGLWHLPFFPSQVVSLDFLPRLLDPGLAATTTSNYELGAVATIFLLGAIALVRNAAKVQVLAFGIAAISGNSLVLAAIDPTEAPLQTIIGWSLCYIALSLLMASLPDIARLFRDFFRIDTASTDRHSAGPRREPPEKGSGSMEPSQSASPGDSEGR